MAIHPVDESPAQQPHDVPAIDVEAWTEQAVQALSSVTISVPPVHHSSVALNIPLDDDKTARGERSAPAETAATQLAYRRRESLRRDSLKRREALLKGNEGSRRRQRWENDRLMDNPFLQPPLPSDWEVRPTYRVQTVPYYLAPLWDAGIAARYSAKKEKAHQAMKEKSAEPERAKVPKELKEKLKKSKAAKNLLRELEMEIRSFVAKWEEKQRVMEDEGILDPDSEDDEIVFVGRNGQMLDRQSDELKREKLLFHSSVDDRGASFGRWLVHHLGSYYGLETWSVTVGNPARREAYVGIASQGGRQYLPKTALPSPLWGLV